jgi:hypothetical protein
MPWAGVPETPVHKDCNTLLEEDEVGFAEHHTLAAP